MDNLIGCSGSCLLASNEMVQWEIVFMVNPLYTGGLLDNSICHFRGVRSILSLLFYF